MCVGVLPRGTLRGWHSVRLGDWMTKKVASRDERRREERRGEERRGEGKVWRRVVKRGENRRFEKSRGEGR